MYVSMYFLYNFIKRHVPLQRMLEISLYLLCYILYYVCYKLSVRMHCFSAYFSRILFPYFADVSRLPLTIIDSLLCASYKVSKFIEFTSILNHLVCLFARSELDRGQSLPAFLILWYINWQLAKLKAAAHSEP
jgi:hypothetical protein